MSVKRTIEEAEPVSLDDATLDDERELRRRIGRDLAEFGLLGDVATRTADALVAQLRQTRRKGAEQSEDNGAEALWGPRRHPQQTLHLETERLLRVHELGRCLGEPKELTLLDRSWL